MNLLIRHIACCGVLVLLLNGCASVPPCPEEPSEGNMGSSINSFYDEFAPVMYGGGNLLFTTNRDDEGKTDFRDSLSKFGEDIYMSERLRGRYAPPERIINPPLNSGKNDGTATFYVDRERGRTEMIFASFAADKDDCDLYSSVNDGESWSEPKPLLGLNSRRWDSHPALSPDGQVLVFASDREGGMGGSDLYISFRRNDTLWTAPTNMGRLVNSRFDEISPAFSDDNTLFYASRAYSPDRTFDLVFSNKGEDGVWGKPRALPYPFNTQFDEITPAFWRDSLLFSSNRVGGCGGYDLYAMRLCDDVLLEGEIDVPFAVNGPVLVYDESGSLFASVPLRRDGRTFAIPLPARSAFTLRLEDECFQGKALVQDISTPCFVEPTMLRTTLRPPVPLFTEDIISFVEIPFFLTGYYRPTTAENLANLRLRAAYGLLTRYDSLILTELNNPLYDAFSSTVERTLDSIASLILQQFRLLDDQCFFGGQTVEIIVEGFADPRPFNPNAVYKESDIIDRDLGFTVRNGQPMDNSLLSLLRAYYSTVEIRRRLERNPEYARFVRYVRFVPRGRGVLSADTDFSLQRRINVKVRAIAKSTSSR